MATLTKDNPAREVRDVTIANDRLQGLSYRELAKKYGVSKMTVGRVLKQEEIKDYIDQATADMICLSPLAVDIQYKCMNDYSEDAALAEKASGNVLKMTGVLPSNVTNQTINNVINIQNNISLNSAVAKALTNMSDTDDDDIIEAV